MENGFDRFFSQGMRDVARRLPPLAEPGPDDEHAAITVLESSAVITWLDRATNRGWTAFDSSLAVATVRRLWNAFHPAERQLLTGIALIVAPLVHVGLVMWHERPAGWLWLMLPSLSLGIGLVTALTADAERRNAG